MTMSSLKIFDIAGSAMSAQSVRLSTVASNLANAESVSGDPNSVYKAKLPVFSAQAMGDAGHAGVAVAGVVESQTPPEKRYEPGHPLADSEGYVYAPSISPVEEMVNMISAARSYQNSVEVLNTAKDLALKTIALGK
jgi:flagellar basal-body rod protein FlgC